GMAPGFAATIGAAALERMEMLRAATSIPPEPVLSVIGPPTGSGMRRCDSFLQRNQIPYQRLDPDHPDAVAVMGATVPRDTYPVVVLRDGTRLDVPTMREVATAAGLPVAPNRARYDVVIVG